MGEMKTAEVVVKLVDGTMIRGKTNLGEHRRLSDRLNRGDDPFLTLFDVKMGGEGGKVLFVNKSQILWAMPSGE